MREKDDILESSNNAKLVKVFTGTCLYVSVPIIKDRIGGGERVTG
jgi:hypothetical protein